VADERISGTLAAAVTPLCDGGDRLDEDAFEPLLRFYGAGGLQGVLMLGTTGEGVLLTSEERRRVAELAVAEAGALRVIVHCGAQTTAETVLLSSHAAEVGADAVAVIAPPYFPFDVEELVEHFAAAAEACAPLPFYLYEYADRSGYAIPVVVIEKLRERVSNLVGIKVSDAPFDRAEPYLATGLDVFIGVEALIGQALEGGAAGAISAVAGAFPEAVSALVADPNPDRAALVESLADAISAHPLQASVKAALGLRGVPVRPDVRAPLLPLQPDAIEQLRGVASGAEATAS
jgi:dihydrodipicolinate synthase/N-acetylneuraminate lyase